MPSLRTFRTSPSSSALLALFAFATAVATGAEDTVSKDKPKKITRGTYYQNPLSFGTIRDTDPPKYARNATEMGIDSLLKASWLDFGLDYRFRYEYRDNDLRRPMASLDQPLLHRTRAYIGIHDILDPFRVAFEIQDSRRENSQFARDNRDVNEFAITRLYGELY